MDVNNLGKAKILFSKKSETVSLEKTKLPTQPWKFEILSKKQLISDLVKLQKARVVFFSTHYPKTWRNNGKSAQNQWKIRFCGEKRYLITKKSKDLWTYFVSQVLKRKERKKKTPNQQKKFYIEELQKLNIKNTFSTSLVFTNSRFAQLF